MEGQSSSHQEFKISGHTVLFPCKPYPSQFSMMDKAGELSADQLFSAEQHMVSEIIRGIERHQNCLLESPTGSGKSLALLCSALAWQTAEKRKIEMENEGICGDRKQETCQCSCHSARPEPVCHQSSATATVTATVTATASAGAAAASGTKGSVVAAAAVVSGDAIEMGKAVSLVQKSGGDGDGDVTVIDDDSDEDFRPLKKFREQFKSSEKKKKGRISIQYEDTPPSSPFPSPSTSSAAAANKVTWKHAATPAHYGTTEGKVSPGASGVGGQAGYHPPLPPHPPSSSFTASSSCSQCSCGSIGAPNGKPKKLPKIFFGTRTHKQVAQIVRELRKTAYHDVAMTILASREHTCIHPQVSKSTNKNEGCEQLMKDVGCRFKDRVMKFQTQETIKGMGLDSAWDLEDLVSILKKKKACPYFVSRGLKEQADLIICPYNYLVDPLIREAMEINLKGQIVLLDEAHNIEDSIREAASQQITQEQIQRALLDMDGMIERGENVADISKLRQMCLKMDQFIENNSGSLTQHDFEQSYTMWSGFDIIAQLNSSLDLGLQRCEQLKAAVASIKSAEQEEKQNAGKADVPSLSTATWTLLEQMFLVLRYLYKDNMKHAEDYRMSIVKSIQYVALNPNGSWLNSRRHFGRKTPVEVFTLNFWCMSPAVGFADFESCRSVILTSGTLSPMDTFQSELGQPFPIILEANHIIKDSQVWVGAVGQGPDGTSLHAVYRNMESFQFQDSLGRLILGVCQKVPKGILCFLPSYKTLEKLTNRWKTTGLWERMAEHKQLMCEPRRSDNIDFEQIIRGYYNVIHRCEDSHRDDESGGVDGALFFAVCRGKVSEGLDFADNFARAVITVGIPYPNFKDLQVELKRKYNDKYQASRGLLSGSLWYEIQAFRALNQALGRCIRHSNDWGALIIVDERFVKHTAKYSNGLSKWVRRRLNVHTQCTAMLSSLEQFTRSRLQAQASDRSLDAPQLPSTPHTLATAASSSQTPPSSFTSPPPSSFTFPQLSSLDLLHPADSRGPLHDVSNVATTAASGAAPFPVTPAAVASSQVPCQLLPHLGPKKTENADARSKGEPTAEHGGESTDATFGNNSLPSKTAVSQGECAVFVAATALAGRTDQSAAGGQQLIIRGPAEIHDDPRHLERVLKSQGVLHFTFMNQPPQPQEQNVQHPAVAELLKTASHTTPSSSATASAGQAAGPVLHGQAVRPVLHVQVVRPVSHGQAARPVLHGKIVRPVLHGRVVRPVLQQQTVRSVLHGQAVRSVLHGQAVRPVLRGQAVRPVLHGQAVRPVLRGQAVRPVLHGPAVRPATVSSLGWAAAPRPSADTMLVNGVVHPGIAAALSLKPASGPGSDSRRASAVRPSCVTVTPASSGSGSRVPGVRDVPSSVQAPRIAAGAHTRGVEGRVALPVPATSALLGSSVPGAVSTAPPAGSGMPVPASWAAVKDPASCQWVKPPGVRQPSTSQTTRPLLPKPLTSVVRRPLVAVPASGVGKVIPTPTLPQPQALLLAPSSSQAPPLSPSSSSSFQPQPASGGGGLKKTSIGRQTAQSFGVGSGSVTGVVVGAASSAGMTTNTTTTTSSTSSHHHHQSQAALLQEPKKESAVKREAKESTSSHHRHQSQAALLQEPKKESAVKREAKESTSSHHRHQSQAALLQESEKESAVKREAKGSSDQASSAAGVSLLVPHSPGDAALRASGPKHAATSKVGETTTPVSSKSAASEALNTLAGANISHSQTSGCAYPSSPSLFGDSPTSASASSPAVRESIPVRVEERTPPTSRDNTASVPEGIVIITASSGLRKRFPPAMTATSTAGNGSSCVVTSPSGMMKSLLQTGDAPGSAETSVKADSKRLPPNSTTAASEEGGMRTLVRKCLFRMAATKSVHGPPFPHQTPRHPRQSAEGESSDCKADNRGRKNASNRGERNTSNRDTSNRGERDTSNRGERDTSNRGERDTSNRGERDTSNRGERETSNRGERDTSNRGERDTLNRGERDTSNRGERDTSNRGERDTSNRARGERDTSNRGERDTSNRGERDTSNRGERETSNRGERDTSNRGERDTLNRGERDTSNRGERDTSNRGERDTSNRARGERDTSNRGERDTSNRGERDTLNRGERDTSNRARGERDTSNRGDRDTSNRGERDTSNRGERDTSNRGERDTSNRARCERDTSNRARGERDISFTMRSGADDSADLAEQDQEEGVEEKLVRRVRGGKRRNLSLGGSSKKKQRSGDLLDSITLEITSSMKCAACDFLLLEGIKESDFEWRDTMPTCLKGMVETTRPEVLYFRGASVTERLKVPPSAESNCRRQQSSEGVEATVELIHCPGCTVPGHHQSAASTLLGAKVTLTDPVAKVSTGQMWIFAHRVTMSA